jgi:3-oxoacyl-[acyl-carrier protein] reductase
MVDKFRYKNRVAIITGCGSERGIGFATARILGKSGSGVAITSTTNRIYERAKELKDEGLHNGADDCDRRREHHPGIQRSFGSLLLIILGHGYTDNTDKDVDLNLLI